MVQHLSLVHKTIFSKEKLALSIGQVKSDRAESFKAPTRDKLRSYPMKFRQSPVKIAVFRSPGVLGFRIYLVATLAMSEPVVDQEILNAATPSQVT